MFLSFYHVFHVACPLLFLSALLLVSQPSGILFFFCLECDCLSLLSGVQLALNDCVCGLLLNLAIHLPFHGLFHLHFPLTFLLLLQCHNVALSLTNDLRSSFARLINLFDNLSTKSCQVAFFSLTLPSSIFSKPMRLQSSFKSSSARLRATLAAHSFLWRVASSSDSYGVRSISSYSILSSCWGLPSGEPCMSFWL